MTNYNERLDEIIAQASAGIGGFGKLDNGKFSKMIDAFAKTGVAKWNTETFEYEPYELPDNCPLTLPYSDESMKTEINCASCAKKVIFGKCYTSKEIHNQYGFGYPVCEDCYNKELEKK